MILSLIIHILTWIVTPAAFGGIVKFLINRHKKNKEAKLAVESKLLSLLVYTSSKLYKIYNDKNFDINDFTSKIYEGQANCFYISKGNYPIKDIKECISFIIASTSGCCASNITELYKSNPIGYDKLIVLSNSQITFDDIKRNSLNHINGEFNCNYMLAMGAIIAYQEKLSNKIEYNNTFFLKRFLRKIC